jgi:hypothetical protein
MFAKIKVLGPLFAVAVVAAALLGTTGARGQTVIHLVMTPDELTTRFLNFGRPDMRLGDRIAAKGVLRDESLANRAGTGHLECVVQRRLSGHGLFRCSYVLALQDGDIILEGLDPAGPGTYILAVTGGTGPYRDARGEATFTDAFTDGLPTTDMVIDLSRN